MENITVYVKFKALKEKKQNSNFICDSKKITNKKTKENYHFDSIINQSFTTKDIFNKLIKQNLSQLLEGISISIISYGQSDTDKTFLFKGEENSNKGLIQLAIKEIFNLFNNNNHSIIKYMVKISYIEICNEEINDLIGISGKNLEIKEKPNKDVFINNLSEIEVSNEEQILEILNKVQEKKSSQQIEINDKSHYIFKILIDYFIEEKNDNKEKKYSSSLSFVDFAGSENLTKVKNKERENINKGLVAFNDIINKLYKNNNHNFINYKESKLTRLLQKYFDRSYKILVIYSIINNSNNYTETIDALNFAKKIKNIKFTKKNNKINYKGKPDEENKALRNKIKLLEKIIKDKKSLKGKNNNNKNESKNNNDSNNKQILKLEKEVSLLKQYLLNNNDDFCSDINSNIEGTDLTSEQGLNDFYNSSFTKGLNLSAIRATGSVITSPYFSSPFSNQKKISDNNNTSNFKSLLVNNNNSLLKNICMTEMRPERPYTENFLLNNTAIGKTEPPCYNFIENSNMKIPLPDLNNLNNSYINNDIESNYLIKENEELKNNLDELKKTYNEIVQSKEQQIYLINQNHDMALENCEKLIKDAENSYINLKSDYDKAIEKIKLKENELKELKQKNINQDSSIQFYEKELNKVGDFNYANEIEEKYNELLEENKELKEKKNSKNIKLKEENELLKKNIGMIESKLKEKCNELNKNKNIINETKKQHEKELQKYKIEIKNYAALSKKNNINKNKNGNDEENNNMEKEKIKEYEDKINKLIEENNEYKNSLEIIEKTQIVEYQKLLDESFAKIAQLNEEISGSKDKNKYLEQALNNFEISKNNNKNDFLKKTRKNESIIHQNTINKENISENFNQTPNKDNNNYLNNQFSNFEIE